MSLPMLLAAAAPQIHCDLPGDAAREAALRMRWTDRAFVRLAEQLNVPVAASPAVPGVWLFSSAEDYRAAGGPAGAAGVFLADASGGRILVSAGSHATLATWHALQHEAFHAFAHDALLHPLPAWLEEGLAEYFGEAVFTGDDMATGLVPPWRLWRLRSELASGAMRPLAGLMALSPVQWRAQLSVANYDQAWSLVHFLLHGEGGRLRPVLAAWIRGESSAMPADLEQQWRTWWSNGSVQSLSAYPGNYAGAVAGTLASFAGRSAAAGQRWENFEAFRNAAAAGSLPCPADQWLPPSLLREAMKAAQLYGPWELRDTAQGPAVSVLANGDTVLAQCVLKGRRVVAVRVTAIAPSH